MEAYLDGSSVLGPNTKFGTFHSVTTFDKGETEQNFRTKLSINMDGVYDENILKSIPLHCTVMYHLHALARSVEKLLCLEVELITQKANKEAQSGRDSVAYVKEKIANLENNINKRG